MAVYFFDSSAVIKRYLSEPGTTWVTGIADPTTGNRIYVARIAAAEVVSAMTRHGRGGNIAPEDLATAVADFRYDFANAYRIVPVGPVVVTAAMALAEKYALRGYDAIQLAAALTTNTRRLSRGGSALTLVSSDLELNAAAGAEGLAVQDPNTYP